MVLSKSIGNLTDYDRVSAIEHFVRVDTRKFEKAIELVIRGILEQRGINVCDTSKSSLERLFNALKTECGEIITISDRYEHTECPVLFRALCKTYIQDDEFISVANEIRVERVL